MTNFADDTDLILSGSNLPNLLQGMAIAIDWIEFAAGSIATT